MTLSILFKGNYMKKIVINLAIVSSFAFAATAVHADFVVSQGSDCVVSGTGEPVRSGFQEHGRSCDSGKSMPASPKQPVASKPASPKKQPVASKPASPKQPVVSAPESPMQPVAAVPASPKQSASSVSGSGSSWDGHGSSGHAASYKPAGVAE